MKMKLMSLRLQNFMGIKEFTLNTMGINVNIYGQNATGKTTLASAFRWLLFDKNMEDRSDFEIKTLDKDGNVLHGLEHSVEGVFEVDGKELALKKTYAEKWTKKRGSAEKQFTGHTVDHFIDKVPATKREYNNRIAEVIDESVFKLLTNPKYFNDQLHWQERRKILLEVCGDVADEDVIASDKALAKLPAILGSRSLDDHRKVIAARRNEINKELDKIPVRIDEVTQGLPDLAAVDKKAHENNIKIIQTVLEDKENDLKKVEAGTGAASLEAELAELNTQIINLKNELREEAESMIEPMRKEKSRLTGDLLDVEASISKSKRIIQDSEKDIKELEENIGALRDKWHKQDSVAFEYADNDTCPTCGQDLPEGQVAAAREKALADFNQRKAEQLAAISKEGQRLKTDLEARKALIADTRVLLKNAEEKAENIKADLEKINKDLTNKAVPDPECNEQYRKLLEQRESLGGKIAALKDDNLEAINELRAEIAHKRQAMRESEAELAKFDQHEAGNKRIKELETQERELAAEYEELEQELYLTEEFIRCKVKLLEERINSRFSMARFKLFNVQVNGGIEECCETLYQGVPYSSLNNGARINVGLDIINTLSDHYQFEAPIFIDNKEAVTSLIDVNAQVIALVVSEKDAKLRVEAVAQKIKEAV